MGIKEGMSALGKGLAAWAETATPVELKLSNIGKPVEVRTWIREEQGVDNNSMKNYTGILESFVISREGVDITLVGVPKISTTFKNYRVEVRVD